MAKPIPPQLLGEFEQQVYRCACGAWAWGKNECMCCLHAAYKRLNEREPGAWAIV